MSLIRKRHFERISEFTGIPVCDFWDGLAPDELGRQAFLGLMDEAREKGWGDA